MTGNFQVFSLDAPNQLKDHKRRKPHKKSKGGCLCCKVKKVKCDQTRPICARCQRTGLPCSYNSTSSSSLPSSALVPTRSSSRSSSPGHSLPPSLQVSLFPPADPSCGTPPQALLHHFELNWASIFVLPNLGMPTALHAPLVHLAAGRPHLLSALLAVSAAHLRHHAPNPNSHRLAEHFQQAIALRSFNELISQPMSSLPPDEIGILLLTAILFNLLTFALPADEDPAPGAAAVAPEHTEPADPSRSWVFSTRPTRLDWLAVQLGLRELVIASLPYRDRAKIWDHGHGKYDRGKYNPLTEAEARDAALPPAGPELDDRVPDAWLEVFGISRKPPEGARKRCLLDPLEKRKLRKKGSSLLIDEDEEVRDHLFREPLFLLAETRELAPTMANVFHYLQFLGKLEPEFKTLLYDRDPRAMWAFGYWLGLVCRFDYIWWVTRRARRDFTAIVIWLRSSGLTERPGREGLLWAEMMRDLEESLHWVVPDGESSKSKGWGFHGRTLDWFRPLSTLDERCL
ncbi:hypothetical protein CONLIGDRAFT_277014 [Coniochaeta ligniaria NRRL 30616]|uniref:Zn(2)-C6 fungal-type domain-containing protein n=1 Tax=Coniochaeta ligniaria NRRL 30616 TaxID=1408157 RepID=A0A1J7JY33_9PEZI|nr:hypothetical protein CONLIGDRAFT_277014 [Coniochaeta ligniaria NRRL 30616]